MAEGDRREATSGPKAARAADAPPAAPPVRARGLHLPGHRDPLDATRADDAADLPAMGPGADTGAEVPAAGTSAGADAGSGADTGASATQRTTDEGTALYRAVLRLLAGGHEMPNRGGEKPVGATKSRWAGRIGPGEFELRDAVLPTVLVHLGLLLFAPLAIMIFGSADALANGPLAIWNHWDGPHFLEVAARGYDPSGDPARAVLFPLYPVLIRIGSILLDPLVAAMTISSFASIAISVGLYRLVKPVSGRVIARYAVLAFNIFPTSYAFVAPYSEAPFLAFTVWAFVAARQDQWGRAGVLGLLAALTRLEGAFLLPALAVEYFVLRRGRVRMDVLAIGLVALGPLVFIGINAYAYGDPLFFLEMQRKVFTVYSIAPWQMFGQLVKTVFAGGSGESFITVYVGPLVAFVLLAAVALWSLRSRHSSPSFAVLTWLNLASLSTLSWPISVPRYLLDVFPVFIAEGALGRRPGLGGALATVSVLLLAVFTTLFVLGHWAF